MDKLTLSSTSTVTMTSSNLTSPMNLLDYCKRSIGEWQSLDPNQTRLLNVETGVKKISNYIKMDGVTDPRTSEVDYCGAAKRFIDSISCTRVTVGEFYRCDAPEQSIFGAGEMNVTTIGRGTRPDIAEIVPLSTFTDTAMGSMNMKNMWMKDMKDFNSKVVCGMSLEDKEALYWALKLRNRGSLIIPGIIESIPELAKMGYDSWLLPNGARVPLNALKVRVLEVAPKELFVFHVVDYYQVGGTFYGDFVVPNFVRVPEKSEESEARILGIPVRRFDPKYGPTVAHYVAEVALDNGKSYIVDPTSTQFKYRGPKRSIVAHGEWGDYVAKFPGMVLGKVEKSKYGNFSTVEEESYIRGAGPGQFITRLETNLNTYLDRRICGYCGRIEGEHLVTPKLGYRYKALPLDLVDCLRCKQVGYCGTACQKLDSINHKGVCRYKA